MSRNTHLLLGLSALFITLNGCDQGGGDTTASNDVAPHPSDDSRRILHH